MDTISVRACLVDCTELNFTKPLESTQVTLEFLKLEVWHPEAARKNKSRARLKPSGSMADFGQVLIAVPSTMNPQRFSLRGDQNCEDICFQSRRIKVVVHVDGKAFTAYCDLHIGARADVPRGLEINHVGEYFQELAGTESFDGLTVALKAENESFLTTAQLHALKMELKSAAGDFPPILVSPRSVHDGIYSFGSVPNKAGVYKTKFCYNDGQYSISKDSIDLKIMCDKVAQLKRDPTPASECVSVVIRGNEANRFEISSAFKLHLQDEYGNRVNAENRGAGANSWNDLMGKVNIVLCNANETGNPNSLPTLENEAEILGKSHELVNGEVTIPALTVLPNPNIRISGTYVVRFTACLQDTSEFTYELRFRVFDEVGQQQKMQNFERKLAEAEAERADVTKKLHDLNTQSIMSKKSFEDCHNKEEQTRNSFRRQFIDVTAEDLSSVDKIRDLAKSLEAKKKTLENARSSLNSQQQRRPRPVDDPSVIGTVCSLAEIVSEGGGNHQDQNLLRVISWHLQSNLDIQVVQGESDGLRLMDQYPESRFQMLDIIRDLRSNYWNQQIDPRLHGFGNPVYVRSLLRFPSLNHAQEAQAQKCLNQFLRSTILVDNLKAGTELMKAVNRGNFNYECPTILTRDGHRLYNTGVIGAGNRAPVWENLRYRMWLAKSPKIDVFEEELRKLEELKLGIANRVQSQTNLDAFLAGSQNTLRNLEERKKTAEARFLQVRTEWEEKQRLYCVNSNQPTPTPVLPQRRIGSRSVREASSPAKRARR